MPSWDETSVWVSPIITRRFFNGLVISLLLIIIHKICIFMYCQVRLGGVGGMDKKDAALPKGIFTVTIE